MLDAVAKTKGAPPRLRPSKDPRLAHIRSKRARQMQSLRNYIYDLTQELEAIPKRPGHSAPLSWHDVAKALQDDTLEQVRENRSLKRQVAHAKTLLATLQDWMARVVRPNERVPSLVEETWRHSQLLAGDDASRQVAYEWILRQVYHNTDRALAHVAFPADASNCLDVRVTFGDNPMCPLLSIQVMTQEFMPFSLDDVAAGYWVAEKTFASAYRERTTNFLLDLHTFLQTEHQDIQYLPEEIPYSGQHVVRYNVLSGRFREHDRMTIALRTILHDEANCPRDETIEDGRQKWTIDTKQWIVADRVGPSLTRCRTFYTIRHPFTSQGDVALRDLAAVYNVEAATDKELCAQLTAKLTTGHYDQRAFFMRHYAAVLCQLQLLREGADV
ncbi:hypothetical protein SPRG_10847 [Saprolegnia parasitica CBS 223.65]|uniref:Uncharacterized protein n=1 Tax=Saprolegnia parasitica (strain CBS 223.65) TaxID=695850 RepID=A0A067C4I8_SAPPC|nr:hypothetical protein SPRG_10847 [Saprolegnia parasitica CBS 223.65]KDO24060.1 hypothetical protein SPRG_10847 [Saprolegnia parasitica CBS 223.65]|eukprot:XP_012205196.1 hypothetical protein SPRG_10847 [Saprolegnia parasitica CBS 223.65]